jgi:hypothetical protein
MRNGIIVRSNASKPARFSSSSAIGASTGLALRVSTTDGAMIGTATATLISSDRVGRLPRVRTAARPVLATGTRAQLSLGGLVATHGPPPASAFTGAGLTRPAGIEAHQPAIPPQGAAKAGQLAIPQGAAKAAQPAISPQGAAEATATAVKPVKPGRIEMTIDSLPNYDLLQPIPVVIEPLGDRLFAAEAPNLEISTTGSSIGGSFLQLKEQIAAIYEQCRQKSTVTPERLHQLALFQAYIGKAKRGWPLGRG